MKVSGRRTGESVPRVQLRLKLLVQPQGLGLPKRKTSPKLMKTLGGPGSRAVNPLFQLPALRLQTARIEKEVEIFRQERRATVRERVEFRAQRRQNDSERTITQLTRIIDSYPTPSYTPDYLISGRKLTPDDLRSNHYASVSPFRQSVPYQVSKQ